MGTGGGAALPIREPAPPLTGPGQVPTLRPPRPAPARIGVRPASPACSYPPRAAARPALASPLRRARSQGGTPPEQRYGMWGRLSRSRDRAAPRSGRLPRTGGPLARDHGGRASGRDRSHRASLRWPRGGHAVHVRQHGTALRGVSRIRGQPADLLRKGRAPASPVAGLHKRRSNGLGLVSPLLHQHAKRAFGFPVESSTDGSRSHEQHCSASCATDLSDPMCRMKRSRA